MPLQPACSDINSTVPVKHSAINCENGRHSALSGSKAEIGGIVHATCRHCGCELIRFASSRRWIRVGELGLKG